MALATSIPDVSPVYEIKFEIDTTPIGNARTWAALCAGINNVAEALNEVVNEYYFLCGGGFGASYITGMHPTYTLTGVRVIGDTAQDYIFGFDHKFGTGDVRQTHVKLTRTHGETTEIISANATIRNITDIGGGTTDGSAISFEISFDGKPESGDAWTA